LAQSLGSRYCIGETVTWQKDGELIAAQATDDVMGPLRPSRNRANSLITGGMTTKIIDLLEVINIEQDDAEGTPLFRFSARFCRMLKEGSAIANASQRIRGRKADQFPLKRD
jgi:hypothetical protein